jgi:hypothetical protein
MKKLWEEMDRIGIFSKDKFEDNIIKEVGKYHNKNNSGYDNLGFTYPDIREAIRLTRIKTTKEIIKFIKKNQDSSFIARDLFYDDAEPEEELLVVDKKALIKEIENYAKVVGDELK